MKIRDALVRDISILASHHRSMFEEIWSDNGEVLDPGTGIGLEKAYARKLKLELEAEICKAWIVEDNNKIVSSGAITFVSFVPNPFDLSSAVGYLHSLYTLKTHRNRKCAQMIIQEMMSCCKSRGVRRMTLNSSAAGQPVYEKMGFKTASDSMRLFLG